MHLAMKPAKYVFLLLCFCGISICHAIGFGELKLYSYLGEPLYAEVAVTGHEGIDISMLQINLASAKDFMRAGIGRPYILNSLAFQIISYDGKPYIVIRTNKPIEHPYIEFLLEMSWPSGNLVKEFTVLLDPLPVNLAEKKRLKGFGQLALEAAASQAADAFNPIEQQVALQTAKQQKEAAEEELSKVVKTGTNKFSDRTFDTDIAQTAIIPGVVPDITQESDEYNKQREAFEKSQQQKQAKPPAQTLLQKVVTSVDDLKEDEQEDNITVKQILDHESIDNKAGASKAIPATPALAPIPATTAESTFANDEPVDFQEVIKPVKGKQIEPPLAQPAAPILTSPATPALPEKPANHMYLGVILSLLLIAIGVVIAIKRGLLKPFHKTRLGYAQSPETSINEIAVNENADGNRMRDAIAEFNADEETEEIELSSVPDSEPKTQTKPHKKENIADEDLSKFEETFANLDLNELREDVNLNTMQAETPVIDQIATEINTEPSNLSNQSQSLDLASKTLEAELKNTKPELTSTEQEITQYITENENIVSNKTDSMSVATTVEIPEDIDEVIEEIPVLKPDDATKNTPTDESVIDEVIEEIPVAESFEATAENTTIDGVVESAAIKDLELSAEEDNSKDSDITILTPETTENLPKETTVTGPTMQDNTPTELHLSEEGATLVSNNDMRILDTEDAVAMKIKLAKKYIESGDRDSAKELLQDAMEFANDDQKLEVRLLLGTIE